MGFWTHVRVRQSTHTALCRMVESRDLAAQVGTMHRWWDGDQGPTFDALIAWLIGHVERDRARARAAHRRARERRREELLRAVFDVAAQEAAD